MQWSKINKSKDMKIIIKMSFIIRRRWASGTLGETETVDKRVWEALFIMQGSDQCQINLEEY